jgi:hypothetical protein
LSSEYVRAYQETEEEQAEQELAMRNYTTNTLCQKVGVIWKYLKLQIMFCVRHIQ